MIATAGTNRNSGVIIDDNSIRKVAKTIEGGADELGCFDGESDEERATEAEEATVPASQPSLTPTPATPTLGSVDSESEKVETGSTIKAINSTIHECDIGSFDSLAKGRDDQCETKQGDESYDPEREYFSDPDYHDERPVNKWSTSLAGSSEGENCDAGSSSSPSNRSEASLALKNTSVQIYQDIGRRSSSFGGDRGQKETTGLGSLCSDKCLVVENAGGHAEALAGEQLPQDTSRPNLLEIGARLSNAGEENVNESQLVGDSTEAQEITTGNANAEWFAGETTLAEDPVSHSKATWEQAGDEEINLTCQGDTLILENSERTDEDAEQTPEHSAIPSNKRSKSNPEDADERHVDQRGSEEDGLSCDQSYESRRKMLLELVADYSEKLVESIKEEALRQIAFILEHENVTQLKLSHELKSSSSWNVCNNSHEPVESAMLSNSSKKVYTSSLYFDDEQGSWPTVDQQVEQCRTIARQLEGSSSEADTAISSVSSEVADSEKTKDNLKPSPLKVSEELSETQDFERALRREPNTKARQMFRRRRDRMRLFTLEDNSIQEDVNGEEEELRNLQEVEREKGFCITPTRRASLEPSFLRTHLKPSETHQEEEEGAITDTEYEAPKVFLRPLPARATRNAISEQLRREVRVVTSTKLRNSTHCEVSQAKQASASTNFLHVPASPWIQNHAENVAKAPKFKPFLESGALMDLATLQTISSDEFNEHQAVSPQVCLKIVQDLRKASVEEPNEQKVASGGSCSYATSLMNTRVSKGAQLFEKRQLQSSHWIVGSYESDAPSREDDSVIRHRLDLEQDQPSLEGSYKVSINNFTDDGVKLNGRILPTSPVAEEIEILKTDESSELLMDLAPVVMGHAKSQLKYATVSKVPSFSASSRRVVECDSPDLMTSYDDGEDSILEDPNAEVAMNSSDREMSGVEDSGSGQEFSAKKTPPVSIAKFEGSLETSDVELVEEPVELPFESVLASRARPVSRSSERRRSCLQTLDRPEFMRARWVNMDETDRNCRDLDRAPRKDYSQDYNHNISEDRQQRIGDYFVKEQYGGETEYHEDKTTSVSALRKNYMHMIDRQTGQRGPSQFRGNQAHGKGLSNYPTIREPDGKQTPNSGAGPINTCYECERLSTERRQFFHQLGSNPARPTNHESVPHIGGLPSKAKGDGRNGWSDAAHLFQPQQQHPGKFAQMGVSTDDRCDNDGAKSCQLL